jgi:hypothetical protein
MPEIEALAHMYGVTNPLWEVCVTDHPTLFRVFINYNLLQIVVVDQTFLSLAEVSQDVLHCNVTVVVGI